MTVTRCAPAPQIVQFNKGKGIYKDPLVAYDAKRDPDDEHLPSYTIKWLRGETGSQRVICEDLCDEGSWQILTEQEWKASKQSK